MKKKVVSIFLMATMAVGMLAGCGSSGDSASDSSTKKEDTADASGDSD